MTLEEKIGQMVYAAPAIERLGIPEYNWWNEGLHGVGRAGVATVFPQAIGLAATWDPILMGQVATIISDEARARHHAAARRDYRKIYAGLTFWSPNINIFRDPRWGRGQETYGEDPYLSAQLGIAFIRGLQGEDEHYLKLAATPKHYAVHSGPESTRHHFDAQIDERTMREFYLFAFEACVKEGHTVSVMGAYNRVNGEPCCASPTLLEQILRQEWGFDGYVVSDCGAIRDIFENHKMVETEAEAAALAVKNGCELNCGVAYLALTEAVRQGLISEQTIDRAVERLFTTRFRLGMFDPPGQVPYAQIPFEIIDTPEHRALALQAAKQSIVLLKNEDSLLPLSKEIGSIAVIGPNADDLAPLLGNYNGTPATAVTPLEGIRRKVSPETTVYYAQGCEIAEGVPPLQVIPSSHLRTADLPDYQNGLKGNYRLGNKPGEKPAWSRVDGEINFTWKDTNPLNGQWCDAFSIEWEGYLVPPASGTYTIGVSGYSEYELRLDGAVVFAHGFIHHPLLSTATIELEAGRLVHLRLRYTNEGLDPQIQLLWAPPGKDHEAAALEAAGKADVVVLAMGLSPRLEGEEMPVQVDGFAGGDRTDICLPRGQEALLRKIHALGKPVVLLLMNGSALAVNWATKHVPAIVEAWYPGQAGGDAIAEILFGDHNPSGKLPVTFYKSVADIPPFDDYLPDGRTYRYFQGETLYPFGYGLSYSDFRFEALRIDRPQVEVGSEVSVTITATNSGDRDGDEVIQLYTRQHDSTVSRPIIKLMGFERIHLAAGESKRVTFTLHTSQFGSHGEGSAYIVRPGTVEVLVGNSSENLPLSGKIELTGRPVDMSATRVFFSATRQDQ
jgi:beta-glucosidase